MATDVGQRCGAILSANQDEVRLLGYGIRVADEVPHGAGGMAEILVKTGIGNPCILLDNGKKVFGCECWWSSEQRVKEMIGNRKVIEVDVEEARR